MSRPFPFPVLILTSALALLAGFASGIFTGGAWHVRLGFLGLLATVAVSGLVVLRLDTAGRQIEALAAAGGLPDWVGAQAEKNRAKASAYQAWGVVLAGLSFWSGWAGGGQGHLTISAMTLAFQLGACPGMILLVWTQARLLREIRAWSGLRSGSDV